MSYRDLFRSALGNLGRHTARTALTTIGVFVGILTIVTMVSMGVRREMGMAFESVGLETVTLNPVAGDSGGFDLSGLRERVKLLTPHLVQQLESREDVVSVWAHLELPNAMRLILQTDGQEARVGVRDCDPG